MHFWVWPLVHVLPWKDGEEQGKWAQLGTGLDLLNQIRHLDKITHSPPEKVEKLLLLMSWFER